MKKHQNAAILKKSRFQQISMADLMQKKIAVSVSVSLSGLKLDNYVESFPTLSLIENLLGLLQTEIFCNYSLSNHCYFLDAVLFTSADFFLGTAFHGHLCIPT